jgi:uncharacterized repeat protein (TIGR03803 family)
MGGGSAFGGGTVFSIDPKTGVETVLHSFGNGTDGTSPSADLINVSGTLYGTTHSGGTNNLGTVFSISESGTETVLYSFGGNNDGANPYAGLINVSGTLYGTTKSGGAYGGGTVFSIDPKSGAETVLYSFGNGTDGSSPFASLIDVSGTLYGTTETGGSDGSGTVFSIDPKTGAETVLHSFCQLTNCSDGAYPVAGLIDVSGTLYGTTGNGGTNDAGTVFSIDPKTGAETVLHSFGSGTDGSTPFASLIDVSGTLYGTTINGGTGTCTPDCGTVFSITTSGTENVIYSFQGGTDGDSPTAHLIDVGGILYGTTFFGGTGTSSSCEGGGCGTMFSIKP